jgi:hypothetical protein
LLWRSAKAIFTAGKIVSCTSPACAAVESGEVRALVEAAYGSDQQPIPSSLEKAELDAMGAHSGERTLASFHVLDFQKGYDWDRVKWEREEQVRTRLSDNTITLCLARIDDGRIVPWTPVEANDWHRAWALSEVSLRQSQCAGSDNAPEMQALVEAAKRHWTLSEKEISVVVLSPVDRTFWRGKVLDKKQTSTDIFYSDSIGLRFSNSEFEFK